MFRIPVHIVTEEEEQHAQEVFSKSIRYGCAAAMILLGLFVIFLALSAGR